MLGFAVSKDELNASYVFQAAIMLTLLTNLTQFVYNGKSRLPAVLMGIATVMLSVGPLRNMCFAVQLQSLELY